MAVKHRTGVDSRDGLSTQFIGVAGSEFRPVEPRGVKP
jgi:hypothetical protein